MLASQHNSTEAVVRHDWTREEVEALYAMPFNDLLFKAQVVHRQHFDPNQVQVSTLLSIKTGACPEDCKYCPQSARYDTGLEKERLLEIEKVMNALKKPNKPALLVFVWARPGVTLKSAICLTLPKWSLR